MFFFISDIFGSRMGDIEHISSVNMHVLKPSLVTRLCMRSYKHVNPFSLLEEDYKRLKHKPIDTNLTITHILPGFVR